MATCPAGHESAATDFCDVCGMRMGATAPAASHSGLAASPSDPAAGVAASANPAEQVAVSAPAGAAAEHCPSCGADRTGQFCEACGFDFSTGTAAGSAGAAAPAESAGLGPTAAPGETAGPASATGPVWMAVVTADRDYFDSVIAAGGPDAASIQFPAYCPERRFRLTGSEMRIGRRSTSRGLDPEIDLTGPPADPGISHLHAVLTAGPDGGWSVMDPGSSNGTQVNGSEIAIGMPVSLHDGDRIGLGGWTVVRIHVT
jgi:hypothetical protein